MLQGTPVIFSNNLNFCHFIFRTHLQDLKDVTAQVHYESYRHQRLETIKKSPQQNSEDTVVSLVTKTPSPIMSQNKKVDHLEPTTNRNGNNNPVKQQNSVPTKSPTSNSIPSANHKKAPQQPTKNGGTHRLAESKI